MELVNFIWKNIIILGSVFLSIIIILSFLKFIYANIQKTVLSSFFNNEFLKGKTKGILSFILIAVFWSLQQKYNFIQFGKKENYIPLVISILTLYGILYTFLQFTISYALQNDKDKYWGKSTTKSYFIKNLGFSIFKSTMFKILLFYSTLYPLLTDEFLTKLNYFQINVLLQRFWEASVFIIFLLYAYLFFKSLNSLRFFYDMLEKNSLSQKWKIQEEMANEFKEYFKYCYRQKNSDLFIRIIINMIGTLKREEQSEVLIYILKEVFGDLHYKKYNNYIMDKLLNREHKHMPHFINELFIELYNEIEKCSFELSLKDYLIIYRLHDNAVFESVSNGDLIDNESAVTRIITIYSDVDSWREKECTYFKIPTVIKKHIRSYEDLEEIHRVMTNRCCYKFVQESRNAKPNNRDILVESYKSYLYELLKLYKDYFNDFKVSYFSYFWGASHSYSSTEHFDKQTKEIIYDYLIRMHYTLQNKEYAKFILKQLDYKYRVSFIFYHMLYTGESLEWQKDVLFFREIIQTSRWDETSSKEGIQKFVCQKMNDSNIGHRIDCNLIRFIYKNLHMQQLNKEILDMCLNERYLSYARLLKFNYIFSENRPSPFSFYDFEINSGKNSYYQDWKIEFLKEMIKAPNLLHDQFFSLHLYSLCKKVTYTLEQLAVENDFRVFFINHFFELSESNFVELINNYYLRTGIIEFLILKFSEEKYEYLKKESLIKHFSSRVKEIFHEENISIDEYVNNLINRANECRRNAILVIKKGEIERGLKKILNVV